MQVYLLGALLFFAALAVFVFQNTFMVTVHFINWTSPDVSLAVVVLIAACAGALVTFMVDSIRFFKIAKNTKELTSMNKKLQRELNSLQSEKQSRVSKDKRTEKKVEPDPQVNPEEQKPN
ncbi:MAG: LapA family protein [Methanocorpusculum sp.]|nr:LapA family protein [Methanocorpusculum sp.]